LAVAPEAKIIAQGGLRIGRRNAWLRSAPPRVFVSRLSEDAPVLVDGEPVALGAGGALDMSVMAEKASGHVVEAEGVLWHVEFVEGDVLLPRLDPWPTQSRYVVGLPAGNWTVIGPSLGQVVGSTPMGAASVAVSEFRPVWAIEMARRTATCIVLSDSPPGATVGVRHVRAALARRWMSVIHTASLRRLFIAKMCTAVGRDPQALFARYVKAAKRAKRRVRTA